MKTNFDSVPVFIGIVRDFRDANYTFRKTRAANDFDLLFGLDVIDVNIYDDGFKSVVLRWENVNREYFRLQRVFLKKNTPRYKPIYTFVRSFNIRAIFGQIIEKSKELFGDDALKLLLLKFVEDKDKLKEVVHNHLTNVLKKSKEVKSENRN